jgi:hypothetical protein
LSRLLRPLQLGRDVPGLSTRENNTNDPAQHLARPNDEERGHAVVPCCSPLARSSSSVSDPLACSHHENIVHLYLRLHRSFGL